jgi:hypothetical protein
MARRESPVRVRQRGLNRPLAIGGFLQYLRPQSSERCLACAFDDPREAHYVCAVLNSTPGRSRINAGISSEAHAEILRLIPLPPYDSMTDAHQQLSELGESCATVAGDGNANALIDLESEVDKLVLEVGQRSRDSLGLMGTVPAGYWLGRWGEGWPWPNRGPNVRIGGYALISACQARRDASLAAHGVCVAFRVFCRRRSDRSARLCKPEVTGSTPVRSTFKGPAE